MTTTGSFEKKECACEEIPASLPSDRLIESNESAGLRTSARCIRTGARYSLSGVIWLTSLGQDQKIEVVVTQNVGHLGARAVARKWWEPGEAVLVSYPPGFSEQARIVYCQKLPSEDFVLGFRLVDTNRDWITSLKERR
jgi:hypothetical protein